MGTQAASASISAEMPSTPTGAATATAQAMRCAPRRCGQSPTPASAALSRVLRPSASSSRTRAVETVSNRLRTRKPCNDSTSDHQRAKRDPYPAQLHQRHPAHQQHRHEPSSAAASTQPIQRSSHQPRLTRRARLRVAACQKWAVFSGVMLKSIACGVCSGNAEMAASHRIHRPFTHHSQRQSFTRRRGLSCGQFRSIFARGRREKNP